MYNASYLDYFDMSYGQKYGALAALDIEDEAGELDMEKIHLESEVYTRNLEQTGTLGLRQNGIVISLPGAARQFSYKGELQDGQIIGEGAASLDGNSIEMTGRFIGHLRLAERSLTNFKNGTKYTGKFEGTGSKDLNGRVDYLDSRFFDYYEGNVEHGGPHGKGKMVFVPELGRVYEGDINRHRIEGFGKLTFDSGDVVTGDFKDHLVDGEGELVRANGDVYSGRIKQEGADSFEFEIEGRLVRADGSVEEGVFRVDLKDGEDGDGGVGGTGGGSGGDSGGSSGFDSDAKMTAFGGLWSWIPPGWGLLTSPALSGTFGVFQFDRAPMRFDFNILRPPSIEFRTTDFDDVLVQRSTLNLMRTPDSHHSTRGLNAMRKLKVLPSRQALFRFFKNLI